MKTSQTGLAFITKEEGVILSAYDDATDKVVKKDELVKGTLTIGVGHTSAAGEPKVFVGQKITRQEAEQILAHDLATVESQVNSLVKVPLNQNQFDALVSFQFNTGGLGRSSVLRSLNQKDYQGAADNLLKWSKANGNDTLLLGRRKRERELFLTPGKMNPATIPVIVGAGGAGAGTAIAHYSNYDPKVIAAVVAGLVLTGLIYYFYRKHNDANS